eukprot:gene31045-40382_t
MIQWPGLSNVDIYSDLPTTPLTEQIEEDFTLYLDAALQDILLQSHQQQVQPGWLRDTILFLLDNRHNEDCSTFQGDPLLSPALMDELLRRQQPLSADLLIAFMHKCSKMLLDSYSSLKSCDTVLNLRDGERVFVHKIFLMAHFEFFRPLFNGRWYMAQTALPDNDGLNFATVNLEDCDANALRAMLVYCYTGRLDEQLVSANSAAAAMVAVDCIVLSSRFINPNLAQTLTRHFRGMVSPDNVFDVMSVISSIGYPDCAAMVRRECFVVLAKNYHILKGRPNFQSSIQHMLNEYELQSLEIFNAYIRKRADEVGSAGPRIGMDSSSAVTGFDYYNPEEDSDAPWLDKMVIFLREVLHASAETLQDSSERLEESLRSNQQDLRACDREIEQETERAKRQGVSLSVFPFTWRSPQDPNHLALLHERRNRILKVSSTLATQSTMLKEKEEFYQRQKYSLQRLMTSLACADTASII